MTVRAKFQLQEHSIYSYNFGHKSHTFIFRPQYDPSVPEDLRFAKATPTGELKITVDNPAVIEMWRDNLGKQFYLEIEDVLPE